MRLAELPTPCLVLDRAVLRRNLTQALSVASSRGLGLRLDMQGPGAIDIARLGFDMAREIGAAVPGISVATLAAAEYFGAYDVEDVLFAGGVTPDKLSQLATFSALGAPVLVAADDEEVAVAIADHPSGVRVLLRVNAATLQDDPRFPLRLAERLDGRMAGLMSRDAPLDAVACDRAAALGAALEHLAAAGRSPDIVSVKLMANAPAIAGVTELRCGGALFANRALTVLTSVTGRGPGLVRLDAGAVALGAGRQGGGRLLDLRGEASLGDLSLDICWPEQGVARLRDPDVRTLPVIGDRLRVQPEHAGLTAAAHDRYFVVDGDDQVAAVWPRVCGW